MGTRGLTPVEVAAADTGLVTPGRGVCRLRPAGRSVCAAAVTVAAVGVGIARQPVLLIGFVICATVFIPLEELWPLVPRAGWRRDAWVDIAHTFANRIPITVGTGAALAAAIPWVHTVFPDPWRQVVLAWPGWAQFVVALLVADCASYWAHRALHEVPVLWRLHAVHHSSGELDWLSTSRGHPLDQIVNLTLATLPLAPVIHGVAS